MNDEVLYEVRDAIGWITLNRPQARNALTFAMYDRIAAICSDIEAHGSPKVLVLTGAGEKAFAAGTDISQFRAFNTPEDALSYEARIDAALQRIEACRVPTIAAISGAATGGGASIACACDLRIATRDARFGFPVARTLGNCLSMNNFARLATLLGPARVKDIVFTARLVDADEGHRVGLYNEVVPDHPALIEQAKVVAGTIAGHAPLTLRATKEAMRRITKSERTKESDLILMCYMSADFREGIEAFLAKRAPRWQGR
ncbi:enoyl-CoA hydratase/isomerase family protein [Bosea sp. (in: a-proteobacteria)]|uniref:enoyl-CoA hydratase/isomerase family protein n=1 Tax=Bosea sp. (in: a-proteobacteria) TaxID=1871050 RepID=UPI0031FEBDC3